MRLSPVNEMVELVSGIPAPQSGMNLRECEDQSWFKVKQFLCFVLINMFSRTP
jgi:hypothetical protein